MSPSSVLPMLGATIACAVKLYFRMRAGSNREMARIEADARRLLDETARTSEAMLDESRLKAEAYGIKARTDHERQVQGERISNSFRGVEKSFAVQAGREIRILVEPTQVSDDEAVALAREVARRIEGEVTYPGQIKVTVIRELRASEVAR
jgi:HD superfamily phosphodiesterase